MVFLFAFGLVILLIVLIVFSTINIEIENFNYNTQSYKIKCIINVKIKILKNIPIFKIKITDDKVRKMYQKFKYKIDITDIERDKEINRKVKLFIRKLKIELKEMKLRIDIGTEDAVLTSFMVPILGMLISVFIKNNATDYEKQNFIIQPIYCNKNLLNILFSGIFEFKMIHIINIIYILIRKEGVKKNERTTTSNRRTYGHSYE